MREEHMKPFWPFHPFQQPLSSYPFQSPGKEKKIEIKQYRKYFYLVNQKNENLNTYREGLSVLPI